MLKNLIIFVIVFTLALSFGYYVQQGKLDRYDSVNLVCHKNGIANRNTDFGLNIYFAGKTATLILFEDSDDEIQSFYSVSQKGDGYYFDFSDQIPASYFYFDKANDFELSKDLKTLIQVGSQMNQSNKWLEFSNRVFKDTNTNQQIKPFNSTNDYSVILTVKNGNSCPITGNPFMKQEIVRGNRICYYK